MRCSILAYGAHDRSRPNTVATPSLRWQAGEGPTLRGTGMGRGPPRALAVRIHGAPLVAELVVRRAEGEPCFGVARVGLRRTLRELGSAVRRFHVVVLEV